MVVPTQMNPTASLKRACRHHLPTAKLLKCLLPMATMLLLSYYLPSSLCATVTLQENEFQMTHVMATYNGWVPDDPLTCPSGANHAWMYFQSYPCILLSILVTGQLVSKIVSAAYGSDSPPCQMVEVSAVLQNQCLGLETCAPNFYLGLGGRDPCSGVAKWMDAVWQCSQVSRLSRAYATRNGWVPDEPLTCPSGVSQC